MRHAKGRSSYKNCVWKPEEIRPIRWPSRQWENNIKMERKEVELVGANGVGLLHDSNWRVPVNAVIHIWVQGAVVNFLTTDELLASQEGICSVEVGWLALSHFWSISEISKSNHLFLTNPLSYSQVYMYNNQSSLRYLYRCWFLAYVRGSNYRRYGSLCCDVTTETRIGCVIYYRRATPFSYRSPYSTMTSSQKGRRQRMKILGGLWDFRILPGKESDKGHVNHVQWHRARVIYIKLRQGVHKKMSTRICFNFVFTDNMTSYRQVSITGSSKGIPPVPSFLCFTVTSRPDRQSIFSRGKRDRSMKLTSQFHPEPRCSCNFKLHAFPCVVFRRRQI